MKIIIIGSKGFIGNHALEYFSSQPGIECWGADVVVDYVAENYFLIDAVSSDFSEIFEKESFTVCINCSGAASVPDSMEHTIRDFTLNTFNVSKILEAIRKYSPGTLFVNLSSAAVYGNPASLPVSESLACKPVSAYGYHKMMAESLCEEYNRLFGLKTCSLRIFSAYGPGLRKQLLWDIYQKSKRGNLVELHGTGNETRDFIYIEDILAAIDCIVQYGDHRSAVYNIASGQETSIALVAGLLADGLDYKGDILFSGKNRPGDPLYWKADISKLRSLGYEPKFGIELGIKKYVEWLQEKE